MKKISTIQILLLTTLLLVLTLSIGFSAFGSKMYINDISLNVRIQKDIRITGLAVDSIVSEANTTYTEYNISTIYSGITLPYENSTITYRINITNFGNTEMGLFQIINLPDNLTYQITGYQLKDKICDTNNQCSLGITKEFYITIGYKENMYNSSNTTYNLNLNLDFRKFHKITYQNITGSYPAEIIDGDTLEITFPTETITELNIYINNTLTTDYSFNNPTLRIEQVSGDLLIENINVDFNITGDSPEYVSDQITESSNTTVSDLLNMTFEGRNGNSLPIKNIDVIISYQTTTGSTQTINTILTYNNTPKIVETKFQGNTTGDITVSFTNLNIPQKTPFSISMEQVKLTNKNVKITQLKIIVSF